MNLENELNYLSEKIEEIETLISRNEYLLKNTITFRLRKTVEIQIKVLEEEKEILESILSILTIKALE